MYILGPEYSERNDCRQRILFQTPENAIDAVHIMQLGKKCIFVYNLADIT
jgi:hypothetical protein